MHPGFKMYIAEDTTTLHYVMAIKKICLVFSSVTPMLIRCFRIILILWATTVSLIFLEKKKKQMSLLPADSLLEFKCIAST